jgi:hypothetical protein
MEGGWNWVKVSFGKNDVEILGCNQVFKKCYVFSANFRTRQG